MVIAVVGSEPALRTVEYIMKDYKTDFTLKYYPVKYFEESATITKQLQATQVVQAILFSGPTNYHYTQTQVQPTIPWSYIPHSKASLYHAIAEASIKYNTKFEFVSVDSYEPEFLEAALAEVGIQNVEIFHPNRQYNEQAYEKGLLEFHRTHCKINPGTICFTNMQHIQEPLEKEGIPCIRIRPSEDTIKEELSNLRLRHLAFNENKGLFAMIIVQYSFEFDDEQDFSLREWKKMEYLNGIRTRCYETAQRINAAIFQQGIDAFIFTTSRNTLLKNFISGGEYMKLMNYNQTSGFNMWIGIGTGHTMMEAYSRSTMSLNKAKEAHAGKIYLSDIEETAPIELKTEKKMDVESILYTISKKTHINMRTLKTLQTIQESTKTSITSKDLAEKMNINIRNANRIIAKLEDAGLLTITGKKSAGRGRPERMFKISLPQSGITPQGNTPLHSDTINDTAK